MLLSSLQNSQIYIEAIKAKLGSIKIPSVPFLQDAIEKAWKAGNHSFFHLLVGSPYANVRRLSRG